EGAGRLSRAAFVQQVAAGFDDAVRQSGARALFVVTQVMDREVTDAIRAAMRSGRDAAVAVIGAGCNYRELTGLLKRAELLIAMRTHALILATSVHTPAVNVNTYPKSAAYMETIGQGRWNLNIETLSARTLATLAESAWQARSVTRAEL